MWLINLGEKNVSLIRDKKNENLWATRKANSVAALKSAQWVKGNFSWRTPQSLATDSGNPQTQKKGKNEHAD